MRKSLDPPRPVLVGNAGEVRRLSSTPTSTTELFGWALPRVTSILAVVAEHRSCWSDAKVRFSVLEGTVALVGSLFINYFAGTYASLHTGAPLRDLVLDRVPTLPVNIILVEGAFVFWTFVLAILLTMPRTIPFVLKTLSLFVVIRAFFVVLTHLGPPADVAVLDPNRIMDKLSFAGDLFFSGHTGFPFLLSLTFWENRTLRHVLLASSVVFALAVLFGHVHYSIDVFAAFFITDSIFRLAQRAFPEDHAMLSSRLRGWRSLAA